MKDDTISRQAAIKLIQKYHGYMPNDINHEMWKEVKALPPAQPGWNPCSKGLPKKDGDYYVTTNNGQTARSLYIKGLSDDYWNRCVTAWMPLPESYRG